MRMENDRGHVRLHEPQSAVTPGQAAVIYDDDVVLGGGWICRRRGASKPTTRSRLKVWLNIFSRVEHVSRQGNRAPNFKPFGERTLRRLREYFAFGRIDLPLERKNRDGKKRLSCSKSANFGISLSGQAAIAPSL